MYWLAGVGARRGQRRFYTLTAIRQIGLTDQHADARRVLNWIRTKGQHEVSREELRREALGRSVDAWMPPKRRSSSIGSARQDGYARRSSQLPDATPADGKSMQNCSPKAAFALR